MEKRTPGKRLRFISFHCLINSVLSGCDRSRDPRPDSRLGVPGGSPGAPPPGPRLRLVLCASVVHHDVWPLVGAAGLKEKFHLMDSAVFRYHAGGSSFSDFSRKRRAFKPGPVDKHLVYMFVEGKKHNLSK